MIINDQPQKMQNALMILYNNYKLYLSHSDTIFKKQFRCSFLLY